MEFVVRSGKQLRRCKKTHPNCLHSLSGDFKIQQCLDYRPYASVKRVLCQNLFLLIPLSKTGKKAGKFLIIRTRSKNYGHPVRKSPSLYGRKSTPTPKFLGTAEAYFVCYIDPHFQISLIYAFIGCP